MFHDIQFFLDVPVLQSFYCLNVFIIFFIIFTCITSYILNSMKTGNYFPKNSWKD